MCGIAALIRQNGRAESAPADRACAAADGPIARMAGRLGHRGPDATASVALGDCDLGHTRLSIIDLAGGAQPMADEARRYWVSFNGEIYNYRELRKTLESHGWHFRTASDTEVLLRCYQQYGEDCVRHLNGQFAFVVWDGQQRTAFAARDRLGEKPLYWARTDEGDVVLASEIKALLASGHVRPRLDTAAVDAYLGLFYVPPDRTAYGNVFTVPPAGAIAWENGRVRQWRYWEPRYSAGAVTDAREAVEEIRRLVAQAVRRQMVADVPVGAFLSGGLDSSTIVALMTRHTDRPVRTFAVGFGDLINELPYARAVAEAYHTDHHELQMDIPVGQLLEVMADVYDEPFADSSNIPTYLMSQFAARHVKVVLAGDGGDELFGGYDWYRALLADPADGPLAAPGLQILVRQARAFAWRALRRAGLPVGAYRGRAVRSYRAAVLRRRFPDPWERHLAVSSHLYEDRAALWGGRAPDSAALLRSSFRPADGPRAMDRAVDFDIRSYLPGDILVKVDRAAMAHGLETRAPFLDVDLVEFVLALPWRLRFTDETGHGALKPLLRRACGDLWPEALRDRPKQGFGAPIWRWTRRPDVVALLRRVTGAGSPLTHLLPGAPAALRPVIERAGVDGPGEDYDWAAAQRAWSLLCLGLWLERHGDTL
jgi:asparagine synthase (glutamine-hydrolysing)